MGTFNLIGISIRQTVVGRTRVGRTLLSAAFDFDLDSPLRSADLILPYFPSGETQTRPADIKSTFGTSVLSFTVCHPAFLGGLARKVNKY
jgi:hypothetical protein